MKKIIDIYFSILEDFLKLKLINEETFLNREKVKSAKDVFYSLKKLDINEVILTNKIAEKFKIKSFNIKNYNEKEKIFITPKGVVTNGVYYFLNPFNNLIEKISKNNKKYNDYFFKDIGIISEYNYNIIKEKIKNLGTEIRNSDIELKKINTFEILYQAIEDDCQEIIINKDLENIVFRKNNYSYETDFKNQNDIAEINDNIKYKRNLYNIKTKSVDDKIMIMSIGDYSNISDYEGLEKKYIDVVYHTLKSSNGLFLLSEKYPTDYYYHFLKYMFIKNSDKNILSIDSMNKKISGVVQENNKELIENNIDNFDIIFIQDLDTKEKINFLYQFLKKGKLVFLKIVSQDSINALDTIIKDCRSVMDSKFISEKFLASYQTSVMPKVCSSCGTKILLKDHPYKTDDTYSLLFTTNDVYKTNILQVDKKGCKSCHKGYKGRVIISEFLPYDKDIASQIEGDFNMRIVKNMLNSKRWETIYSNSIVQLLKHNITLEDIKNKL